MDVSAATWNTLSKLLDEALDLEPAERASWIDGLSTTQPELAPVLRRLLAAHASNETADVLQRLPALEVAGATNDATGLEPGSLVGPYRLKRELGRGGMADVWLAERADGAFEREVALKLPRLSRLRRDLAARFGRERDILARLEHANIARFYDAGVTDDGLPYLAIEYVKGHPITQWCDQRRLELAARIELFAQVLDAAQFAHANLVIHRDLKPSNVLVTEDGQVRLLDFGIAKLLSDEEIAHETRLTQFAGRVLTPDYASPEQVKGDSLTTATDIYSLGVILYELLVGQLPYRLKLQSAAQLEEAIVTAEPTRPSSAMSAESAAARAASEQRLARALRGDLDTIVLKTLAKEPTQRYATIAELADDLRRYLAGQTVRARPASWSYRTRKFIQRNRVAVGAAATITGALLAAATLSFWQAQLARKQAARAEQVKEFVVSFFDAANTARGGTRQTTAVDLLEQARQRLDTTPISDAGIRAELLVTIGSGLYGLGELQDALPVLEEATRLASATQGEQHRTTAEARLVYGDVLLGTGQGPLAEAQYSAAEQYSRRVGDVDLLAAALTGKARLRASRGEFNSALEVARDALAAAERQPKAKRRLMVSYGLVSTATRNALQKGALEPARRAYALARELYGDQPHAELIEMQSIYAAALAQEGDAADALAELKSVLRQQTELLGPDHLDAAATLRFIGQISMLVGDPAYSIESLEEALRICLAQSAGKPTPHVAVTRVQLGMSFANAHRYERARDEWRQGDELYTALAGADVYPARVARAGAALMTAKLGRLEEADAVLSAMLEQRLNNADEEVRIKARVGLLRSAQGRHDEALALLREASDFFADAAPRAGLAGNFQHAASLGSLGHALLASGRAAESLEILREARTLYLRNMRNGSPDLADVALDIAQAQLALGRASEAVDPAGEAVAYWSGFDRTQRDTGIALIWHARALAAAGEPTKAADAFGQAQGILASTTLPADRVLLEQTQRQLRLQATAPQ
jgi:serine/threonine-protein kinase